MTHKWEVRVLDNAGSSITNNVAVSMVQETNVPKSGVVFPALIEPPLPITHTRNSGGRYTANTPMPADPSGDWRLIVNADGKSIVIQPFTIAQKSGGGFVTTPRNLENPGRPGLEAQAVDIKTVVVGASSTTTFKVRMFVWSEVVLVSGTQYQRPGAPLRMFAEGRRDALRAAKRLSDGTIASIWSLDDRTVFFYFKAKGNHKNWLLGHAVTWPQKPPKKITPGAPWPFVPASSWVAIHIVEVYDYLNGVGKDPKLSKRVKELSFFSHAFSDGPILYNTNDNSNTVSRDPKDFDARVKDFDPANTPRYKDFGKAMAPDARWHIWGCNTNPGLIVMSEAARVSRVKRKTDTEFFVVKHRGISRSEESRVNRRRVLEIHLEMLGAIVNSPEVAYPGRARATLGIDVFAPLPGTWSNFDMASRQMIVDTDPGSFGLIKSYHESEPALASCLKLGTGIDGERYVNYSDYASVAAPAVPPRSDQYELIRYENQGRKRTFIRFHGGTEFDTKGHANLQSEALGNVASIAQRLSGHNGHRYILKMIPDTDSVGLLAVEAGPQVRVFILKRGSSGNFDLIDREL